MQSKDKFLLQSVVASPGTTTKDINPEMVVNFFNKIKRLFLSGMCESPNLAIWSLKLTRFQNDPWN